MPRTTAYALALLLASALLPTACGPRQASPPPRGDATASPDATAPPAPADTAPSGGLHPATAPALVYFARDERVAACYRKVATPAVARGAMLELLKGPTAAEKAAGVTSAIPAGTRLLGLDISGGTATVDLTGEFDDGGGTLSMSMRVAQVVHALTQFSTVERVSFRMDGAPLTVLGGEGLLIGEPQTRADWEDYAPAVLIEHPAFGQRPSSPLKVSGTANVFEGVFRLDLTAPNGTLLASPMVQATSGTGTRGTFSTSIAYSPWAHGTGELTAWYESPKDGSRIDVYTVPLTLEP